MNKFKKIIKDIIFASREATIINFEDAEKYIKIISLMLIPIGGMFYWHLSSKKIEATANYDIVISAFLLGLIFHILVSFYFYGLLLLDKTNHTLLRWIARSRAAFFETWHLFLLIAFIMAWVEKLYPSPPGTLQIAIFTAIAFTSLVIILRILLYYNAIRFEINFNHTMLMPLVYLFLLGIVVVCLKVVIPVIPK